MLNAPNGTPERCDKSLGVHTMPDGYELWRDEDGGHWWHHAPTNRNGLIYGNKWWARRAAIADAKGSTNDDWKDQVATDNRLHLPSYEIGYTEGESSGCETWSMPFEEFLSIELKFDEDRGYKAANDIVKVMNWMIKELEARGVKIPDEFLEKQ